MLQLGPRRNCPAPEHLSRRSKSRARARGASGVGTTRQLLMHRDLKVFVERQNLTAVLCCRVFIAGALVTVRERNLGAVGSTAQSEGLYSAGLRCQGSGLCK